MSIDVNTLINKIPAAERSAFAKKVDQIAGRLGVPFNHLMAIMDLESAGTFDPSIKNNLGYVGLIQFGSDAARDLGTTTDALRKMSRLQQLDYVEKYYNMWKRTLGISKFNDFVDLYLVVFYPAGVKEKDPNKPFTTSKVETQNPALRDANGHITKNSIRAAYEKRYQGLFEKIVEYGKKNHLLIGAGIVVSGLLVFLAFRVFYQGKNLKITV